MACAFVLGTIAARSGRESSQLASTVPGLNHRIFGAALMAACGRGMTTPGVHASGPVADFLASRVSAIRCSDIPADLPVEGLDELQRASRYLIGSIAATWWLGGTAWETVDHLLAVWFAMAGAGAYLICRLMMPRFWACCMAGLFILSPLQLGSLPDIRDYSKAPFFLAALWLALRFVLNPPRSTRSIAIAAAIAGGLTGLGLGMRTDTAILIVFLIVTIALFWGQPLARSWQQRILAAGVCAAVFLLVAAPILASGSSGSLGWHWALLGQARQFDIALRVTTTSYETGYAYSDSVVATTVNAFAGRSLGAMDSLALGSPEYARASQALYQQTLSTFPADMATRGIGAVRQVLELPYSAVQPAPVSSFPRWMARAVELRSRALRRLRWLAIGAFAVVCIAAFRGSTKQGVFGLMSVGLLAGYPAIQYQHRHVFHLELLSLGILGIVLAHGWRAVTRTTQRSWLRPAAAFLVSIAVIVASTAGLRAVQAGRVSRLLGEYQGAAMVRATAAPRPAEGGVVRIPRVDLLPERRDSRSVVSNMLVADIAGERCGAGRIALTFRYASSALSNEFSRTVEIDASHPGTVRVFQPIYETGARNAQPDLLVLDAVELAAPDAPCLASIGRFQSVDAFPLLVPAAVPTGAPLYQRLRDWEVGLSPAVSATYWAPLGLRNDRRRLPEAERPGNALTGPDFLASNARLREHSVVISGVAEAAGSYLATWKPRTIRATDAVCLRGVLSRGGARIGLEGPDGWVATVDIHEPGRFDACLQPPRDGQYQLVVANSLSDGERRNQFELSHIRIVENLTHASACGPGRSCRTSEKTRTAYTG